MERPLRRRSGRPPRAEAGKQPKTQGRHRGVDEPVPRLAIQAAPTVPLMDFVAQAPTTEGAAALANAATIELKRLSRPVWLRSQQNAARRPDSARVPRSCPGLGDPPPSRAGPAPPSWSPSPLRVPHSSSSLASGAVGMAVGSAHRRFARASSRGRKPGSPRPFVHRARHRDHHRLHQRSPVAPAVPDHRLRAPRRRPRRRRRRRQRVERRARRLVAREFPAARVVPSRNHGFSHANNRALMTCDARYVLFPQPGHGDRRRDVRRARRVMDARPHGRAHRRASGERRRRLDTTIRRFPNALRALGDALGAERLPEPAALARRA